MSDLGNEGSHTEYGANVIDAARVSACVCTLVAMGHKLGDAQARCVKTAK
jgi:hypothetical protein